VDELKRVAVEQSLTPVKEYLSKQGFDVVDLNQQMNQVEAVVISGQDKDVMGMQDMNTKAAVINANGLTPEEVAQFLNQ